MVADLCSIGNDFLSNIMLHVKEKNHVTHNLRMFGVSCSFHECRYPQVSSSADKVTGTMIIGKNPISFKHVYAYRYPGLDPTKKNISFLFSDRPMNEKIFRESLPAGPGEPLVPGLLEGAWKSMHFEKMFEGLAITINADKKILTNEVLVGGPDKAFSISSSDLLFEPKTFDSRITGRIRTATETVDLGAGNVFGLDVSFDAGVVDLKIK